MSAQSSPEGPLPAKDSQLLFAAGESPTVEAGMQARRAALLKLNESYDGLGDAMATDPTEIPVDFLRAQPLLAVQMAALAVAPGRMQEVVRVASSRTKEFPTAADAIEELIRVMQEEVIEQLLELQEAGQQAAAQERSSGQLAEGRSGAGRLIHARICCLLLAGGCGCGVRFVDRSGCGSCLVIYWPRVRNPDAGGGRALLGLGTVNWWLFLIVC